MIEEIRYLKFELPFVRHLRQSAGLHMPARAPCSDSMGPVRTQVLGSGYAALGSGHPALGSGYPALGSGFAALGCGYPALGRGYPDLGSGYPHGRLSLRDGPVRLVRWVGSLGQLVS